MVVESLSPVNGDLISSNDLLEYLSRVILQMTDDQTDTANKELANSKRNLEESKARLESTKDQIVHALKEYKKLTILNSVLSKIEALRKEGVLVGQNRIKILSLLSKVENQSYGQLETLEKKLSIYVPESQPFVW
jgi:hypothetical protein